MAAARHALALHPDGREMPKAHTESKNLNVQMAHVTHSNILSELEAE